MASTPGSDESPYDANFVRKVVNFRGFPASVTSQEIYDIFSKAGKVSDIQILGEPYIGHGRLTFSTVKEARHAAQSFDYLLYREHLIRVFFPELKPVKWTKGCRKVLIEDLISVSALNEKNMKEFFEGYGTVVSWGLISTDSRERDGFVEFEEEEGAEKAITELDGKLLNGDALSVKPFVSESEREEQEKDNLRRTVIVRGLTENIASDIPYYFAKFGVITGVDHPLNEDGSPTGAKLLTFEKIQDASGAINAMKGCEDYDVKWALPPRVPKKPLHEDPTILVTNLQDSVSEKYLWEMFTPFGWVISCKVIVGSEGLSCLVAFRTLEDATRAINAMDGKVIAGKSLSVALIRSNDEKNEKRLRVEEPDQVPAPMSCLI